MTPDQINARVAEILLAEGETWGYIDHCYNCSQRDWWPCKPGGRDYSWGLAHCITGCREYALNEVVEPLDFCSNSAAAWKLYCYWFTRDTVAAKKWIADAIFIDPTALAAAFIASEEKKCQT